MPVQKLVDRAGESIKVTNIDGFCIFNWPMDNIEENFRSIINWTTRASDVYLCTYPKSGLHWTWETIKMLIQGDAKRILLPHTPTMEFLTQEEFDNMESPRVITTHLRLEQLPKDLLTQKCKIVMCHRNPKDVMVSFYHHHLALKQYEYKGKWENYFYRFIEGNIDFGSWFDYMNYWENIISDNPDLPIHVMYYEDLKQNGIAQIKRLADFLVVEYDNYLIEAIHKMCSFERMKPDKDKIANKDIKNDENSSFYRKGIVGDWKNWFSVAQNEYFNKVYEEKMKNTKLRFTFE